MGNDLALYQIAVEFRDTLDLLADPETDPQFVADTLASIFGTELQPKAVKVAKYIKNLETAAALKKARSVEYAEQGKSLENRAKNLTNYLQAAMETAEIRSIKAEDLSIEMKIKDLPDSVVIDNLSEIEERFLLPVKPVERQPDKKKIAIEIKAGRSVLGAHLNTSKKRLVIK